jgi:hypothetical protein
MDEYGSLEAKEGIRIKVVTIWLMVQGFSSFDIFVEYASKIRFCFQKTTIDSKKPRKDLKPTHALAADKAEVKEAFAKCNALPYQLPLPFGNLNINRKETIMSGDTTHNQNGHFREETIMSGDTTHNQNGHFREEN